MFNRISKALSNTLAKAFLHIFKVRMVNKYKGISAGKKFRISTSTFVDYPQNLKVDDNVYIGHHCFIEASNGITIGEGCQITNYVNMTTHSSHKTIRYYGKNNNQHNMKGYLKGEIQIGKYSFIGPFSTIMPGTSIGKGCVVAAYSFVKGDFPDFSVIKGNPAQVVGSVKEEDRNFIKLNPELKMLYDEWAN